MVRNKNPSHPFPSPLSATASISKHGQLLEGHASKDAKKGAQETDSPHKHLTKRRSGPSSPSKVKLLESEMNGAIGYGALGSNNQKILAGASGVVVQLSQLNGYLKMESSSKTISGKLDEKYDEKIEGKVDSKTENDGHSNSTSRMHASSRNVYRKMFGRYKVGQELLARWSDGLYYLGVICDVYDHRWQCEMKFEDESRFWIHFKDLHHIGDTIDEPDVKNSRSNEKDEEIESDMTCVLCRDGASDPPNEIVLCDKCGQGYHQQCHLPHIDDNVLKDEEVPWQCRNCVFSSCVRSGGAVKHGLGEIMKQMKCVFPYDINSLSWNKNHKINDEETYCYCGGPGDWYLKMLQCARCDQWFHEACLQCLESPILYGDRYFLFVCAVCNNGNEFIKRLPMKWVDVVHLVLYNITIAKKVKYYDIDAMIAFFCKHMDSLRLTDEMAKEVATRANLRQKVAETLSNNRSRFQPGAECKKVKVMWGLKNRSPPVPPSISLPAGIEVTDETFSSLDLKHGSASLSDSPTPLKKQGPCQTVGSISPRSKRNSKVTNSSPVKDLVKSGLFGMSSVNDDDSDASMPPPKKRRPGRPKKLTDLPSSVDRKRTSSISSLNSSKLSWPVTSGRKRKRKFSETSVSSGRNSETSISRLWSGNSSALNDAASSCSSGSTDKPDESKSLRDAVARYFGAEDRIKCGERFRVLGKRITRAPDGTERFQYLIEWEGYTAKDLEALKKT